MAPVDTSRSDPRSRGGGLDQKRSKPKPRLDGDELCAICDNGGNVTCCDGGCQRSFHLTDENSEQSRCRLSLGLTKQQAEMILAADDKDFICKNCKYKQHQCFACGVLESSDLSSEPKVFQCEVDDCGHFYHPKCVANLLYPQSKLKAELFAVQVEVQEKFSCPIHECIVFKGAENKNHWKMQFAVCRRCPTTYHRKCLPRDIPLETKKGPNGYMQRAWDEWEGPDGHVIHPDRILIYCTKHAIKKKLGTPKRNHIIFPDVKKLSVPKRLVDPPNEKDIPEEGVLNNASPEPSQSPPAVASDQNQCSCSGPFGSFAPASLFRHPHPGTGGWIGD